MLKLSGWGGYALVAVLLFLVFPLLLVWAWDNLFVQMGAPVLNYLNGVALEFWGLVILCAIAALREVK